MSVVSDVGNQVGAENDPRQPESVHVRELASLLEISHAMAATLELQPGLILDKLREMVEYDRGWLFALEGSTLVSQAFRGMQSLDVSHQFRISLPKETLPEPYDKRQPIRVLDVWGENPPAQKLRLLLDSEFNHLFKGMHSCIWVPLVVTERIIGGIGLAHKSPDHFTAHHVDLVLSVANQTAITMTNTELNRKAQAFAVVEERERIARNLHDAVNQSLFSAGLIAEVLPRLWERDQEEAKRSLEDLRKLTRGAMAEMRALLAELRPSTLTDTDLGDLLQQLAKAFIGRVNVQTQVTAEPNIVLPAKVQVAMYRVCQEALNNIAKHAAPSLVNISLKQRGATTELSIRDDGRGFDPQQTSSGHYGLSMMRERAAAAGAEFFINSQRGHGTELIIRWSKPQPEIV
jgi:signal transduction histidine kinase